MFQKLGTDTNNENVLDTEPMPSPELFRAALLYMNRANNRQVFEESL